MKCVQIKKVPYDDHADVWRLITNTGESFPYSKTFKDKTVDAWLKLGHMIAHKLWPDGTETWTFID
jgi:hypothetical protein